jgi:hypothetical protein
MPRMDFRALALRATDLLWCLAISDVDESFGDRSQLLDDLRILEARSAMLGREDLYAAAIEAQGAPRENTELL